MLSLKHWRPRHLLGAWVAYWVALVGVSLGPALAALARVSGPAGKGSASLGFNNGILNLVVTNANGPTYSGVVPLQAVVFWLAGPPLVIWAIWMMTRPSRRPVPLGPIDSRDDVALGEGDAFRFDAAARERDSVERD